MFDYYRRVVLVQFIFNISQYMGEISWIGLMGKEPESADFMTENYLSSRTSLKII